MQDVLSRLGDAAGEDLTAARVTAVSGGDIAQASRLQLPDGRQFFLKQLTHSALLEAEAEGLRGLAASETVRVPGVVARAEGALLLEWLTLTRPSDRSAARFGEQLAGLHRRSASAHGGGYNNFIGHTPQANPDTASWTDFYRDQRLLPMLDALRAVASTQLCSGLEQLCSVLPTLLAGHEPTPALVHGDLWGGNWAALEDGGPVCFDPAAHYADRETDLAMTRLFGGFPADFYAAYDAAWPLPAGAQERVPLYQLYHVLNHARLFGGSYLNQAESLVSRLLAAR